MLGHPLQVPRVAVINGVGELDLDSESPAVVADNDEVNLMVTVAGAEVADCCLGRLCRHANTEPDLNRSTSTS